MPDLLSAKEILEVKEPGGLFTGDEKKIKTEYGELARKWHPDRNGNSAEANKVMGHINVLYQKGLQLLKEGKWESPNFVQFEDKHGLTHKLRYLVKHDFELGTMYIGNKTIIYVLSEENEALFKNAESQLQSLPFANEKMRDEVEKYLPFVIDASEITDGRFMMAIHKTPDLLLLRDVLNYYKGKIEARHVAWILSTLHNLACYLDFAGLSHNGITLDTYFISPKHHSGALLGGWWYAVPQGSKMLAVPESVYAITPPRVKASKQGSIHTDLEAIRAIGRELLGDRNGTRLLDTKAAPEPMINWLRISTADNALHTYTKWGEVLDAAFGPRKFVKMELDADMLYK